MFATRQYHFGPLPDASWAVFFLGGLYLGGTRVFALFMVAAVAIDYIATEHLGVSTYCLSPAYVFLLPAYATLWLGGAVVARRWRRERPVRNGALAAVALTLSVSVCFLVSNGTFYWFGGRVPMPSLSGWVANLRDWYGYFLAVPCAYAAGAGLLRGLAERVAVPALPPAHAEPLAQGGPSQEVPSGTAARSTGGG
ncbi:MAG TPA: hypothetical protein VMD56_03450 [Steroidobacteraceae bacterium]|nr:hypothetical protein [Steroidobacteraceae bacterium]